jgi:phytoene synthase
MTRLYDINSLSKLSKEILAMAVHSNTWESSLLSLALEAMESPLQVAHPIHNQALLQQAYDECEAITAVHSRSFYLSSSLLPAEKKKAVRALYAFCRITDDIVDRPDGDVQESLWRWRQQAFAPNPSRQNLVAVAWADTRTHFHVPIRYAEQLIDGVTRDLTQTRYQTFADLATYCYGVASTVGLMSMHITGFASQEALPYAIKLGLALQLTNILRDVAEDWQRGRVYLPQDELAAFGITESHLAAGVVTERWRQFMSFQIERNQRLYAEAWPGIELLHQDGRFAIAAAAEFYRAILNDIEAHDYDIFSRRAFVGKWGKLRRLPMLWWQTSSFSNN